MMHNKPHTAEAKAKMSAARKAQPVKWGNLPEDEIITRLLQTDATTRSIAAEYGCCDSVIKKIFRKHTTVEQRLTAKQKKQAQSITGRKQSDETIARKRTANTGVGNPFFGRKHSPETLRVLSKRKLGSVVPYEVRKAISVSLQGVSSEEWEGFKSGENERARNTSEYSAWRTAVFERDNFTCRMCGKRGGRLHAHHIKTFSKNPELRYVVSNGVTLCAEPCHRMTIGHEAEFESRFLVWVLTFELVKDGAA